MRFSHYRHALQRHSAQASRFFTTTVKSQTHPFHSAPSALSLSTLAAATSLRPKNSSNDNNNNNNSSSNVTSQASLFLASAAVLTSLSLTSSSQTPLQTKTSLESDTTPSSSATYDYDITTLLNWSGTHSTSTKIYHEPETTLELERTVKNSHTKNQKLRPVGSALSPNGIAFSPKGMIGLANLDKVLSVDEDNLLVTVQAGARVSDVLEALRPHGLTIPNLASIAEQQMGGFTQIGAHGTGASIPPVDEFVTALTIVTPAFGTMTLTKDKNGPLFDLCRVGLGCVGIVSEVTMRCVPAHNLVEVTRVVSREEAVAMMEGGVLGKHKHLRYMWIPFEDAVVVVTNDPEGSDAVGDDVVESSGEEDALKPFTDLLKEVAPGLVNEEELGGMGFGELRDTLLAIDPLNVDHVKRINKAEHEFWKKSAGVRIRPSDQLLQFDCGGQQWVKEICFPTGSQNSKTPADMQFMSNLLSQIESHSIPAPSPIEQRWSSSSSSPMSPAHGPPDGLHSWVGIIMYLPSDDTTQRDSITQKFKKDYCGLLRSVGRTVGAVSHWAKLELPEDKEELEEERRLLRERYPVAAFNMVRLLFDPKRLLENDWVKALFGPPFHIDKNSQKYFKTVPKKDEKADVRE